MIGRAGAACIRRAGEGLSTPESALSDDHANAHSPDTPYPQATTMVSWSDYMEILGHYDYDRDDLGCDAT